MPLIFATIEKQAKTLQFQDVREDLRHAIAKDTVTIKNEGLTVEEHGNEGKSGECVSELSQPGCQDALDFQKKITPRRDSEQASSLNARGPSRLISGRVCKLCCVAYSFDRFSCIDNIHMSMACVALCYV